MTLGIHSCNVGRTSSITKIIVKLLLRFTVKGTLELYSQDLFCEFARVCNTSRLMRVF